MPKTTGPDRGDFTDTWPAAEGEAGAEVLFGSRGPIHTAPGDLDDTKRSTEAGLGFVVALLTLLLVALFAVLGWWATGAVWLGVRQ